MNETAYALFDSAEQLGFLFVLDAFGKEAIIPKVFLNKYGDKYDDSAMYMAYSEMNERERLSFWHVFLRDNPIPSKGGETDACVLRSEDKLMRQL